MAAQPPAGMIFDDPDESQPPLEIDIPGDPKDLVFDDQPKVNRNTDQYGFENMVLRSLIGQGLAFNFGDEAEAWWKTLGDEDPKAYDRVLKEVRGNLQEWQTANPGTAITSEILGGIMLPGLGTMGAAAKLGGKAAMAAGSGAGILEGGLSGLGASEGENITERFKDARLPAGIGAVVGPAGPAVSRIAAKLLPGDKARSMVEETLTDQSPRRVEDMGDEALVLGASPGTEQLAGGLAQESRRASPVVEAINKQTEALDARLTGTPEARLNIADEADIAKLRTKETSDKNFGAVRAADATIDLRGKLGPAVKRILDVPDDTSRAAARQVQDILKRIGGARGDHDPEEVLNVLTALQRAGKDYKGKLGGDWDAVENVLKDELRKVPGYTKALREHAANKVREEGLDWGKKIFGGQLKADQLDNMLGKMGPEFKEELARVVPGMLREALESKTGNPLRNRDVQRKIRLLLGDDAGDELIKDATNLARSKASQTAVHGGSQTGTRKSVGEMLNKVGDTTAKTGGLASLPLLAYDPKMALGVGGTAAILKGVQTGGKKYNELVKDSLQKLLLRGGDDAADLVRKSAKGPQRSLLGKGLGVAAGGGLLSGADVGSRTWQEEIEELMRGGR